MLKRKAMKFKNTILLPSQYESTWNCYKESQHGIYIYTGCFGFKNRELHKTIVKKARSL